VRPPVNVAAAWIVIDTYEQEHRWSELHRLTPAIVVVA
jgi:hypothetical protein